MSRHSNPRWQHDNMSMDDYSHFSVVDQSAKFQKSASGVRNNNPRPSSSARTQTAARSRMDNDGIMRRRQMHPQQKLYQQQQNRPQHRSHHLPQHHASTLESLVQKPKSFNSKQSTAERTKAPETTRKPKQGPKQQPRSQPKPKPSKTKNKLKLLNCFANSHQNKDKYDDPEALRQQALIAREQYSRRNQNALSPTSMATQDVYFDTKSIASRSTAKHRNHHQNRSQRRTHNHHNAQHILEDLQEEEQYDSNGSGEDRGGSFINLSISDIEERFERRDAVPLQSGEEQQQQVAMQHAQMAYESATTYQNIHQTTIPSPQEQNIPGKNAKEQTNAVQATRPIQTPPTQYEQYQQQLHRQLQIRTNALDSKRPTKVEQRRRSEPRQPLTKQEKQQQQQQKQEYYKHRLSGNITPVGATTPQKAIPWIKPQSSPPAARTVNTSFGESEQDTSQSTTEHKENIPSGPLCHFCGGPHWVYDCPHMDESTAASRRRRQRYYEYDDDESDFSSLESYPSRQSNLLQCQPCLKGVTNALKASLQAQPPNQR